MFKSLIPLPVNTLVWNLRITYFGQYNIFFYTIVFINVCNINFVPLSRFTSKFTSGTCIDLQIKSNYFRLIRDYTWYPVNTNKTLKGRFDEVSCFGFMSLRVCVQSMINRFKRVLSIREHKNRLKLK